MAARTWSETLHQKAAVHERRGFQRTQVATQSALARAVRAVPIRLVSISKNNSPGADLMAGEPCTVSL